MYSGFHSQSDFLRCSKSDCSTEMPSQYSPASYKCAMVKQGGEYIPLPLITGESESLLQTVKNSRLGCKCSSEVAQGTNEAAVGEVEPQIVTNNK